MKSDTIRDWHICGTCGVRRAGHPPGSAPLFWPWFLFNWEYDSSSSEVKLPGPEGRTVAELYAEEHGNRLDPLEHKLIESINRKPYTFFEVEHVVRGKGMRLKDVFQGSSIEVQERSGSEYVQPGDLVFSRAVSVDGVGMIIGLAPPLFLQAANRKSFS